MSRRSLRSNRSIVPSPLGGNSPRGGYDDEIDQPQLTAHRVTRARQAKSSASLINPKPKKADEYLNAMDIDGAGNSASAVPSESSGLSSPASEQSTRPTSIAPTPIASESQMSTSISVVIPQMSSERIKRDVDTLDDGLSDEELQKNSSTHRHHVKGASELRRSDYSLAPSKRKMMDFTDSEDDYKPVKSLGFSNQSDEEMLSRPGPSHPPPGAKRSGKRAAKQDADIFFPDSSSSADEPLSLRKKPRRRWAKTSATNSSGNAQEAPGNPPPEASADGDDLIDSLTELETLDTDELLDIDDLSGSDSEMDSAAERLAVVRAVGRLRRGYRNNQPPKARQRFRDTLELNHPELMTMWTDLEKKEILKIGPDPQPSNICRRMKPFQLEGLAWMKRMETTPWRGGLLGDEMGLGKTIQAVSLIMSDFPVRKPSLVLVPPVALMQWVTEIDSYTDGTLKTFVFHGTNSLTKSIKLSDLKRFDVIMMSYNSLEAMYRREIKGHKKKMGSDEEEIRKKDSIIHKIDFHRVILDEAHEIKTRTTSTARACFALKATYRWCLTGTPLQNRIGEFFSLLRFLNVRPFASYFCKDCPCESLEWQMDDDKHCTHCRHFAMSHVSVFNQELLNPIQNFGNVGPGAAAFRKLRLLTDRIMLRRLKKDHTDSMELPIKELCVSRQFFGEVETDFANSIMSSGQRRFDTYVAQGVLLNNYANIFGLIMQMRQVADHPDLLLKRNAVGGQNILECCICECPAEEPIRSRCKHDFCRSCARTYLDTLTDAECPRCHIPLVLDLNQPELEQDALLLKKSSIVNRIKMDNWTSSTKIESLIHELFKLRSDNSSHKSIIFSQFTSMLQLIEWRLRHAGFTTVMLDGSMTPAQRAASIKHFMNNVDVECFLVSLRAGGVALNLTEASRVFLVEPWWNPAVEWQSADRCHRIGQTRPCTITNLVIEDSVESRMVLLQEKKTRMIHSTIDKDDKAMESLTPEDMQFLFRGN